MLRIIAALVIVLSSIFTPSYAATTKQHASNSQALLYAAQAIVALTGGTTIGDVTLTGNVTWNGTDTGTLTLRALGLNESRMDLALSDGTLTEIRDSQTGAPLGQWISQNNSSGYFASQNCWTDSAWFFPVLSSLSVGPTTVLSYIGKETRNGVTVQHIQSYQFISGTFFGPTPQQLSTIDFFLDATTFLPTAVAFNVHPDDDMGTNLAVEIDYSEYQKFNGISVPTHIQKLQQGNPLIDITITDASFNTGLSLSVFAISQPTATAEGRNQ
jgi:hypothetical protein